MESFAALLFLASLICLILGLIKPTLFKGLFKKSTSRKVIALTFGLIMVASMIVVGVVAKPKTEALTEDEELNQWVEEYDKKETEKEKQKQKEAKQSPAPELTPEDKIRNVIEKELNGNNNNDKPWLRNIDLAMENNNAFVIINYNASDNLTKGLIATGIKSKMSDLYFKLYKSGLPIGSVSVCAYMPLTDKYGNESDDIVYTTRLEKEEAAKINWSADDATLKMVVLPKVWNTLFLHPALSSD